MTAIRFTDAADMDLEGIWQYIRRDSVTAANGVLRRIRRRIDQLRRNPDMGRAGHVAGTRELIVPDLLYLVVYRHHAGTVEILRVLHGAQEWPPPGGDAGEGTLF